MIYVTAKYCTDGMPDIWQLTDCDICRYKHLSNIS